MHPLGEGLHLWSLEVHLTALLYVEDGGKSAKQTTVLK